MDVNNFYIKVYISKLLLFSVFVHILFKSLDVLKMCFEMYIIIINYLYKTAAVRSINTTATTCHCNWKETILYYYLLNANFLNKLKIPKYYSINRVYYELWIWPINLFLGTVFFFWRIVTFDELSGYTYIVHFPLIRALSSYTK